MLVYQRIDCKQSFLLTSDLTPGNRHILPPRPYPSGIRGFPIPPKHPSLARLWNIKPEWQQIVKIWDTAWASTYKACQHIHNQTALYNTMHTYNVVTSPELLEYPSNSTRFSSCNNPFEHEKQLGSGNFIPYIAQPVGLGHNFLGGPLRYLEWSKIKNILPQVTRKKPAIFVEPGKSSASFFVQILTSWWLNQPPLINMSYIVKVGDFVFPSFFRGWKCQKRYLKVATYS